MAYCHVIVESYKFAFGDSLPSTSSINLASNSSIKLDFASHTTAMLDNFKQPT